jgi:hypothetical protein
MPVTELNKFLGAIAAANDQSSELEQVDIGLKGVEAKLALLNDAQVGFNEALAISVQTQTESTEALKKFLNQQMEFLLKVIPGMPELIPLKEANSSCIQDAFTFMRTLNEIESLMTDSRFTPGLGAKSNHVTLQKYKSSTLYQNCIAILVAQETPQKFQTEFNALFDAIDSATPQDRAQRLIAIHQFRDRILHFFAEQRPNASPEELNNTEPPLTASAT